jgi:ankyrin repeat protein
MDWTCHFCLLKNKSSNFLCLMCQKSQKYAADGMSYPFHGDEAFNLRSEQIETVITEESVNDTCEESWTALHHAILKSPISSDQHSRIERLIQIGSDVNASTRKGYTPLHLAIETESFRLVSILIEHNANVNAVTYGEKLSPLHMAVSKCLTRITQLLIAKGASVNCTNVTGQSPLHMAAKTGNMEIGYVLIKAGADIDAIDTHCWTVVQTAEFHGQNKFIEMMHQASSIRKHGVVEKLKNRLVCSITKADWHGAEWDSVMSKYHSEQPKFKNS